MFWASVFTPNCTRNIRSFTMASKHSIQPSLPNLIFGTTYALNKSGSKSAGMGLQCFDGRFKPILKLYGPNLVYNTVILDKESWTLLLEHKEILMNYVRGDYSPRYNDFDSPTSINFFNFEIRFTTAHQEKAIGIAQLSPVTRPPTPIPANQQDGQNLYETPPDQSTALYNTQPPPVKKRRAKLESVPMFTMHAVTCDGLFQLSECINHTFTWLSDLCGIFDRAFDFVVNYLQEKINEEFEIDVKRAGEGKEKEGKDNARNNMKNKITCPLGFSLFFNLHKADIKSALDKQEQIGGAPCYDKRLFDKFFIELSCFYQYMLRIQLQPLLNFLQ